MLAGLSKMGTRPTYSQSGATSRWAQDQRYPQRRRSDFPQPPRPDVLLAIAAAVGVRVSAVALSECSGHGLQGSNLLP